MPRRGACALLLAILAAGCGGSDLPDPPESYVTFRDARAGVEFRHPRGWTVERPAAQPGSVLSVDVRPPGANPDRPGPLIRLRVADIASESFEAFAGRRERLTGAASAEGIEQAELDDVKVPGAARARGKEAEYDAGGRRFERVVVSAAAANGTTGAALEAGAPAGDRSIDPRAVAGSLRLR